MTKVKIEKIKLEGNIEIDKPTNCDRCGNDFAKGMVFLHFPYKKLHIALCHVCLNGLMYGFFKDICTELKNING